MTKDTHTTDPGRSRPTREELDEIAVGAEGLFEHPNLVPGVSARGLSPREMVAATHEPREDQTQDPGLFTVETPLIAIGKDGIQLLRKQYTGLDMLPLTTGPKNRLRRDLVMRYNRAELARGILREIVVLERDAQGVYTELGRATRSDVFRQDTDYSVVLRERAGYVQRLFESVKLDTEQFHRIESGSAALEELVSAIHARERLQRKSRQKAIVSTARWDSGTRSSPEADADYEAMRANRPEAVPDIESDVPDELRLADVITGAGPMGEDGGLPSPRGSRGGKEQSTGSKTSVAGKGAAAQLVAPARDGAADETAESVPPLAGGSTGLADLLSSAPLTLDNDDS